MIMLYNIVYLLCVIIVLFAIIKYLLKIIFLLFLNITDDEKYRGIEKFTEIFVGDNFYIIPSISIIKTNQYYEISINWLKFEYYINYHILTSEEEEERSSIHMNNH